MVRPDTLRRNGTALTAMAITATTLLCLIALFNYRVDPAGLFSDGEIEKTIVGQMKAGKFIAFEQTITFRDRVMAKHLIGVVDAPPSTILLGSSRTWPFQSRHFPGGRFLNHSVSEGVLEDYLGLFANYARRGLAPKTVVLTAEPWILNRRNGVWRHAQIHDDFLDMAARLNLEIPAGRYSRDVRISSWSALISLDYFKASWRLYHYRKGRPVMRVSYRDSDDGPKFILRPDGSMKRAKRNDRRSVVEIAARVRTATRTTTLDYLGWFDRLDPFYTSAFERFVVDLQARGIRVVLYFPPYHPSAYRAFSDFDRYDFVAAANAYFRRIAASRGLEVFGDYNPAIHGCGAHEFIDAIHATPPCLDRIAATWPVRAGTTLANPSKSP